MMILINSSWIPKRSEISGVDMVGGGVAFDMCKPKTFCYKKSAMPLIPLEVERQTICEVPKYGI